MQHAEPFAREAPDASSPEDPADPPSPGPGSGSRSGSGDVRQTLRRFDVFVEVLDEGRRLDGGGRSWLREHAERALGIVAEGTGIAGRHDARLRLVGDEAMARAHEAHKGVSGTTDVLTFDLREDSGAPLDADILLCVDEAARQAAARGIPVARELLLYAVHGLLHCAGHDDPDEASAARMHAREDEILEALGVGTTYADTSSSGGGGR